MKNRGCLRERYLRDAWPTRLAGLAASLGRVAQPAQWTERILRYVPELAH